MMFCFQNTKAKEESWVACVIQIVVREKYNARRVQTLLLPSIIVFQKVNCIGSIIM